MRRSGTAVRAEGWAHPSGLPKAHYFDSNDRSLCGKWVLSSDARKVKGKVYNGENCVRCRRKLERRGKR